MVITMCEPRERHGELYHDASGFTVHVYRNKTIVANSRSDSYDKLTIGSTHLQSNEKMMSNVWIRSIKTGFYICLDKKSIRGKRMRLIARKIMPKKGRRFPRWCVFEEGMDDAGYTVFKSVKKNVYIGFNSNGVQNLNKERQFVFYGPEERVNTHKHNFEISEGSSVTRLETESTPRRRRHHKSRLGRHQSRFQ